MNEPTASPKDADPRGRPNAAQLSRADDLQRPSAGRTSPTPAPAPAAEWNADPYADALRVGKGPLFLRRSDGWLLPLEVERWCGPADAGDATVLQRCAGRVLDIGCGPGRLVAALRERGHTALGIDVSPAAIDRTERSGGIALHRSVFGPLPGEGRWETVLLVDGNVGIGGNPHALLERIAQIVHPHGLLLAESDPAEVDEVHQVRIDDGIGSTGPPFAWARVGAGALLLHARKTGWTVVEQWAATGRFFVGLRRS